MTKKNKIIESVTIEDFASEGKCITRVDGRVIFVQDTAPGDVADIRIVKKKKNYLEAVPVRFHEFSRYRTDPFCRHYDECGGCKWQHVLYEKQLELKYKQVKDQFERIGGLKNIDIRPVLGCSKQRYYRNKLEYTFSNKRWLTAEEINSGEDLNRDGLGFHKPGQFDKVLDIEQCHLQFDLTNKIRNSIRETARKDQIPFYDLREHTGFLRNLIIRNSNTGEWMVILQVKSDVPEWTGRLLGSVVRDFPEITSAYYIINEKRNESYFDLDPVHYSGRKYITERMGDLVFKIGPKSFFQTNSSQAHVLYSLVSELADIRNDETVFDLFTGTGSIALFVARQAHSVLGIEQIEEAIEDARVNAELNSIDNVRFITGDMKDVFNNDLLKETGIPDVVITDPPRAGMHHDVVENLIAAGPDRIVYVSCNPATQARDIDSLSEFYSVSAVQPVDMFPHTHHIENVALLKRNKNGKYRLDR